MKDFGKLCGGCFVHAESPDVDRAPYKGVITLNNMCMLA